MTEQLNGNRESAWNYFRDLVAATLLSRGLVPDLKSGYAFASDLDMSFDELYSKHPRETWQRYISLDCDEYQRGQVK